MGATVPTNALADEEAAETLLTITGLELPKAGSAFPKEATVVSEEGVPTLKDVAVNDYTDAYSDGTAANNKYQDFRTEDNKAVVTFNVNKIYDDNVVGIVDAKTLTADEPTIIQA